MHAIDSLTLKIHSFLLNAGIQVDPSVPHTKALTTYFKETYGVEMLALMEQEWVAEQVERDITEGPFKALAESRT